MKMRYQSPNKVNSIQSLFKQKEWQAKVKALSRTPHGILQNVNLGWELTCTPSDGETFEQGSGYFE